MMFDRAVDAGAFFRRHGRVILMSVAGVVIVGGLARGAFTPGLFDFGVLTALIVRRFGLMRTTVTALVLVVMAIAATAVDQMTPKTIISSAQNSAKPKKWRVMTLTRCDGSHSRTPRSS